MSNLEFTSRLQHLSNVLEIICLSSTLNDYSHDSLVEGLEYNERVVSDIEHNLKSWESLNRSIDSTCWQKAKSYSDKLASRDLYSDNSENFFTKSDFSDIPEPSSPVSDQKWCTSFNSFRKKGCQYKYLNPGRSCKYVHSCSYCKGIGLGDLPHKALQCPDYYQSGEYCLNTGPEFDFSDFEP